MTPLLSDSLPSALRIGTGLALSRFGPARSSTLLMLTHGGEEASNIQLVVIGGHKRGNVLLVMPEDACVSAYAVSRKWMITKWQEWIDPDSSAEDVMVIADLLPLVAAGLTP